MTHTALSITRGSVWWKLADGRVVEVTDTSDQYVWVDTILCAGGIEPARYTNSRIPRRVFECQFRQTSRTAR